MPVNGYFDTIFASGGDLNTIPDATQPGGTVSYEQGFPVLYSTAVTSGGYNVPRTAINQVLNDITTAIQAYQRFTTAPFITSTMNGGSPFSYAQYATVLYSDGHIYQSLVPSNTQTPPGSNWAVVDPSNPALRGIGSQQFSTAGTFTYTPSAGMTLVLAILSGGGGGGGGGETVTYSGGAGGAASGTAISVLTSSQIGSSQTVTIGAAGNGGASGAHGNSGSTGGTSSLGSLISATGGNGGGYGPTTNAATATSGGVGSGALLNLMGTSGTNGIASSTSANTFTCGGTGGSSFWSGGGFGGNQTINPSNGFNGSGGGGGTGTNGGAAGGAGTLLLIEFIAHN